MLWEKFQLHELVGIVLQSSVPDFAHLLDRVWEGQHTNNDVTKIKTLADTNTATWFDEFIKLYLNNYLAGQKNKDCLDKLDSEFVIKAQDSNKKIETNTSSIYLVKLFSFKLPTKEFFLKNWNHVLVRGYYWLIIY